MTRKSKFPFNHIVKHDCKEVWVECTSSITAIGLSAVVKQFYPGYTAKIGTGKYLTA